MKIHYKSDDKQAPAYLAKVKHEPVEYTGAWNRIKFGTNLTQTKQENIVLAKLGTINITSNNNSSDFIVSSPAKNCFSHCSYCYVTRHTLHNSPVTIFTNIDDIVLKLKKHISLLKEKEFATQQGDKWVYEISCDTDIGNTYHLIEWNKLLDVFRINDKASCTMASKTFNKSLCSYPATRNIRIRMSLSPQWVIDSIEKGTSSLKTRLNALQKYYDAGFEVHINLSPLLIYPEEAFEEDYRYIFDEISKLSSEFLKQTALEVIVLTTTCAQHEMNLELGNDETYTWNEDVQEGKVSKTYGSEAIRYKVNFKKKYLDIIRKINKETINIPIKYIF
jgi:DNA repair photolyase